MAAARLQLVVVLFVAIYNRGYRGFREGTEMETKVLPELKTGLREIA